jgi:hypothetical protein
MMFFKLFFVYTLLRWGVSLMPSYYLGSEGLKKICLLILKSSEYRVIALARSKRSNFTFFFFLSKICILMSRIKICKVCTPFTTYKCYQKPLNDRF